MVSLRLAGRVGNLIIQTLAVPGIWDTQNGFKAFSAESSKRIFSRTLMPGFSFDIEVLAIARGLGYKVGIIPVNWVHNPDSSVTIRAYINVLLDVFGIRWNLIRNRYNLKFKEKSSK